MSENWETEVKIGKNVRGGGGSSDRQTVIRGNSNLNAARRDPNVSAALSTEKKFATGNRVTQGGSTGQHLTKVDRSDDIVAIKKVEQEFRDVLRVARETRNLTQKELANASQIPVNVISAYENSNKQTKIDHAIVTKLQNTLRIFLTGKKRGEEFLPTKREKEEKAKAEKEAAKKAEEAAKKAKEAEAKKAAEEEEEAMAREEAAAKAKKEEKEKEKKEAEEKAKAKKAEEEAEAKAESLEKGVEKLGVEDDDEGDEEDE